MTLLAIDPGSRAGFAVLQAGRVVLSGVWDLTPPRGASPGVRYLRLRARLEEVLTAYPDLALVAVEQAHQRGGAATEYAVGVVTHVYSWAAERGIEHLTLHSATVKRVATGKGNANKAAMVDAARDRWGETYSDDEADARWLAVAAWHEVGCGGRPAAREEA